MRFFLAAAMLALMAAPAAFAAPGGGDPLGTCDEGNTVGETLEEATGECGGTVEPWQCLGGSSSSKTIAVGPYDVVVNQCDSGLPDPA